MWFHRSSPGTRLRPAFHHPDKGLDDGETQTKTAVLAVRKAEPPGSQPNRDRDDPPHEVRKGRHRDRCERWPLVGGRAADHARHRVHAQEDSSHLSRVRRVSSRVAGVDPAGRRTAEPAVEVEPFPEGSGLWHLHLPRQPSDRRCRGGNGPLGSCERQSRKQSGMRWHRSSWWWINSSNDSCKYYLIPLV